MDDFMVAVRPVLEETSTPVKIAGFGEVPVIIWDIDGPLNPFLSPNLHETKYLHWGGQWNTGHFNIVEHPVWMEWFVKAGVQMVWGSNWGEDCLLVNQLFHLPEMDYIRLTPSSHRSWKLPSVSLFLEDTHPTAPVIWVDDELYPDAAQWAEKRGDTLLVPCDPRTGWVEREFNIMQQFCNQYLAPNNLQEVF